MSSAQPSLETLVLSNEKLLKAVVALLALKDEHFLAELKTIFALAAREGSEIAGGDAKVWAEIKHELAVVDRLIHGEDEDAGPGDDDIDDGEGGGGPTEGDRQPAKGFN